MAHLLTAEEAGIEFGTEVRLLRPMLQHSSTKIWIEITGDKTSTINLRFDRAGYNHYDGLYAYCFKLPSTEEFWIEIEDSLNTTQRVKLLHEIFQFI